MPLRKCMKKTSHREYLVWMAWLDRQWDRPSRTDNYLMQVAYQVAYEVRRIFSTNSANMPTMGEFKLRFKPVISQPIEVDTEQDIPTTTSTASNPPPQVTLPPISKQVAAGHKSSWLAAVGAIG